MVNQYDKRFLVFDIETDGLQATKVHCVSGMYTDKIVTFTSGETFLGQERIFVGHNILRYDIPTLNRVYNTNWKVDAIDTLAISWYLYPDRLKHGLESWGDEFGIPKIEVDNWIDGDINLYIQRCERDVQINSRLWEMQLEALRKLYKSDEEVLRLCYYLSFKMHCAALQEASGWLLDNDSLVSNINELEQLQEEKTLALASIMPKVQKKVIKRLPAKPFKQDGSLSSHGQKWFDLLKSLDLPSTTPQVEVVDRLEDPNPNSGEQMKDFLFSLGWEPDEFVIKDDPLSPSGKRKIPQINTKKPGAWGLSDSVKKLVESNPTLEPLDGLSVINHRLGILNGFFKNKDENNSVKAEVEGLTNTLRYKHKTVVNLPKVTTRYGDKVRSCLIAPPGYVLCGSDMSSLEDRTKQHYIYPYDPDYVKEMQTEGYDPHLALAVSAKAMASEDAEAYKSGDPDTKKKFKTLRDIYKTTNYACQYGAGGPKIATAAGVPRSKGYDLHEAYWKKNKAILQVADSLEVKTVDGYMWVFNPVSRFWYSLRNEKDKFSTLNQGTGVYCFDMWLRHVLDQREQLTATFHDEGVWCIPEDRKEDFKKILEEGISRANKQLNLNVQLKIDIQFGKRYSEIH